MARYDIVPERSKVWIDARSTLHPIHAETDGLEGWVDVDLEGGVLVADGAAPSGHLELPVERLRSGNPLEDRELKRRIDARRYPTIDGDLSSMVDGRGDGSYTVTGDLTFIGVTRPYTDQMDVEEVDDKTIKLTGHATFDVRDFGLEPPRILMLRVEPDVAVRVEIIAQREE